MTNSQKAGGGDEHQTVELTKNQTLTIIMDEGELTINAEFALAIKEHLLFAEPHYLQEHFNDGILEVLQFKATHQEAAYPMHLLPEFVDLLRSIGKFYQEITAIDGIDPIWKEADHE